MTSVLTKNLTRRPSPRFAYTAVADAIVPSWEISLVFVGPTKARELNRQLRGKEYTPNVLSYALSKTSGEVIICLAEAAKQAPLHSMTDREFVLYLFIHGLLHLKGWAHGVTMERCEQKLLSQFLPTRSPRVSARRTSPHEKNSDRNRHRNLPSQGGRR